jgi:hypothetical protein
MWPATVGLPDPEHAVELVWACEIAIWAYSTRTAPDYRSYRQASIERAPESQDLRSATFDTPSNPTASVDEIMAGRVVWAPASRLSTAHTAALTADAAHYELELLDTFDAQVGRRGRDIWTPKWTPPTSLSDRHGFETRSFAAFSAEAL